MGTCRRIWIFVCADVQSELLTFDPVDLIYAALVFEYVDISATFATVKRNLRPGGTLAVLLQLPHSDRHAVSASPYKSLNKLIPALKLVEPDELRVPCHGRGICRWELGQN